MPIEWNQRFIIILQYFVILVGGGGTLSPLRNSTSSLKDDTFGNNICKRSAIADNNSTLADSFHNSSNIDVFFVNLDRSIDRRVEMFKQLSFYGFKKVTRIKAITLRDVIVPQEISNAKDCKTASNLTLSYVSQSKLFNSVTTENTNLGVVSDLLNKSNIELNGVKVNGRNPYHIVVTSLCGRPKNTRRELVVTISHLIAMRTAIYQPSNSPYALILEDDMQLGFDIDFNGLAQSAPEGFGILQLVTSNDHDLNFLLKEYKKDNTRLWWLRVEQDYWCAGAYLINKHILKPIIDTIFQNLENEWIGIAIIAGYTNPCYPSHCCNQNTPRGLLNLPCIKAPRGYQSDHFIFNLAIGKTYMITLPLITTANSGNLSTLHQDHVAIHHGAFHRINNCIQDIIDNKIPIPLFINKKCQYKKS